VRPMKLRKCNRVREFACRLLDQQRGFDLGVEPRVGNAELFGIFRDKARSR
jgi:hypothetical protein